MSVDNSTLLIYQATLSPGGVVGLISVDAREATLNQAGDVPGQLVDAFHASMVDGLTMLVTSQADCKLPPSIKFWRDIAEYYFKALCRQTTSSQTQWTSPQVPDEQTRQEWLDTAPPMRGLEYASLEMFAAIWTQLDVHTQSLVAKTKGGLASYLHKLRPDWNLVGRVTFHLAENKKNPERPFAFLATFTEGTSASGSVQHIPLAEALKRSIAEKDSEQLKRLLAPVSLAAQTNELVKDLLETRAMFTPQAWGIKKAFEFLSSVPQMEEAGVIVRVPNWWNASRPPRPQVQVKIGSKSQSLLGGPGALDLDVGVSIDGETLSAAELKQLMAAREGMTLLRGKWVQVDQDKLHSALHQWETLQERHVSGVGFLEGMRMLAGASLGDTEIDDELRSWTRLEPGPWLRDTLASLREPSGKIKLDPQSHLHATLRPYQVDGVRWLWFATRLGLGVCLADDMGLGKTIQVISLLLQIKFPSDSTSKPASSKRGAKTTSEIVSPSLLIVPTSLLGNWQREVAKFAPELRMFVAHRSVTDVSQLKRVAEDPASELQDYDLIATTYGLARREKWLSQAKWRLVILDEAQAIKNAGAAQTRSIKAIPSEGRIVLSGTPVENHLGDLWSLFDFCSPGLLGTATEFKKFVKADDQKALSKRLASIRQLIRPYVLRRMKTDPSVAPDLPDKTEMRVDCGLTPTQVALYQQVTDELGQSIDIATGIQRQGMVLAALMQLKQICNHPSLYLKSKQFDEKTSGKYAELQSICETLIEKQEKLLVFTQFQSMCDPIEAFLSGVFGRRGLVLTGKTAASKRGKMVAEFQQESGPPFFVISVKAGGTGLNLTQASHVVHFDRWWNPAVEDQATDRAFRIGQKRNVIVHKFVCRGTLEERIDELIQSKKAISHELFGSDGEIQLTQMTTDQLMSFIAIDINKATVS